MGMITWFDMDTTTTKAMRKCLYKFGYTHKKVQSMSYEHAKEVISIEVKMMKDRVKKG